MLPMTHDSTEKAIEEFNKFVEKWCKTNYPHLLDSDENDGERFRQNLRTALKQAREEGFELGKNAAVTYLSEWANKANVYGGVEMIPLNNRFKEARSLSLPASE